MRGALGKLSGVGTIDAKVGEMDFGVSFDSKTIQKDAIVKALVAAGYEKAGVKS